MSQTKKIKQLLDSTDTQKLGCQLAHSVLGWSNEEIWKYLLNSMGGVKIYGRMEAWTKVINNLEFWWFYYDEGIVFRMVDPITDDFKDDAIYNGWNGVNNIHELYEINLID